jgi:hypothetical protein
MDAAAAAVTAFNERSNSALLYSLAGITEASGQVVSGMKYELRLDVVRSDCLKKVVGNTPTADCHPQEVRRGDGASARAVDSCYNMTGRKC